MGGEVKKFMVFDVESIGLHGEGFAVGWVVVDDTGDEVEVCRIACDPSQASGNAAGRQWVKENARFIINAKSPRDVREGFWARWLWLKSQGVLLAADVAWPVEATFLTACIREDHVSREWEGPYPLIDIASVRFAAGLDPLGKEERQHGERPEHDPVADARQSARLLIEALKVTRP